MNKEFKESIHVIIGFWCIWMAGAFYYYYDFIMEKTLVSIIWGLSFESLLIVVGIFLLLNKRMTKELAR